MSTKPNFFIIGMARAATTSLWEYLQPHPEIYMSPVKEPGYFAGDMPLDPLAKLRTWSMPYKMPVFGQIREEYRDKGRYMSLFSKVRDEKIIGEASTIYIRSNNAAEEIHRFNPKARVLLSLRNPVDALYSAYYLHVSTYLLRCTFDQFVKGTNELRIQLIPRNIEKYRQLIGRENLKIVFFDDFQKDTKKVYGNVLKFLGVDQEIIPEFKIHNASQRYIGSDAIRRIASKLHTSALKEIRQWFSQRDLGITQSLISVLSRTRRPSVDEQTRRSMTVKFLPTIHRLEELTGRDLSHWA